MTSRPITAGLLQDIFTGFQTKFRGAFNGTEPQWSQVATPVISTARTETYSWLGNWPKIREWLGDRVVNQLAGHGYSITNKRYESTVEVEGDDIRDDQLGLYGPMFEEFGRAVKIFPDELVFPLLTAGFVSKCYDGQPFFDTDHPVGDGVVSNMAAGGGIPWFLLDTTRAIKPLVYQDREAFNLVGLDNPNDANVFWKNKFVYGTTGRCNAGYAFWQMAFGSKLDLTAANFETAKAAMSNFADDSGRKLGIKPNLWVGPASLEGAARRLFKRSNNDAGATNEWEGAADILVAVNL